MKLKIIAFVFLITAVACKKKDQTEPSDEPATSFDKQALLVNVADQIILPNYLSFQAELLSLKNSFEEYSANPTFASFENVQSKLIGTYTAYQHISLYEFGPAEEVVVRSNFNVFPTDTVQINNNITSGTYNLNLASNFDAKGLPALDFLLFGNGIATADLHNQFATNTNKQGYVKDLLSDMKLKIENVIAGWNTYRGTFVNSLSTDVSSSIGYLVNQLNFELDYVKNAKIGIPLGKKTLGIPLPTNSEAFYSAKSLVYAKESLKAIEAIYLGKNSLGSNGLGFDDYLDHLKIDYNGESLNSAIKKQFGVAFAKLNTIPETLSQQVLSNPASVDAAYVELVKLLVLLKTDMPSSLGVVITYQDGDGD